MLQSVEHVASLRSQLWDCGFRPVPVLNADKVPIGRDWGNCARKDPPDGVRFAPVSHALNTGVLADGLRAIDLDIDDTTIARQCRSVAVEMFGEAPIRTRRNSPRCLLLYRAAEGMPTKVAIAGTGGKVEVLGRGQQFVAFGTHPSGADLEWFPDAPGQERLEAIPAVSEAGILEYLRRVAPLIGAQPPKAGNGHDHAHVAGEAQADPLRIAAALASIPNRGPADWEHWNTVGMAVWRATGGSPAGWEAWNAWSARNDAYAPAETRARWDHYFTSPPTTIGAGSIFFLARPAYDDIEPATLGEPPPTIWDGLEEHAAMLADEWDQLEQRKSGRAIPASPEAKAKAGKTLWTIADPWDAAVIDLRPWIARGYLMRGSLTVISGPGSAGKSSLMVAWASALALGCAFHRMKPSGALRVATYNVEDDANEQKRRFSALLSRLSLSPEAFDGRLAILGPTGVGTLLHTARDGTLLVNTPIMDELEAYVAMFRPDVLMLDPFVELHEVEENDNTAVRSVMARLRSMAVEHDMAIVILHHARKGSGEPGEMDSLRGASSIVGAARVVLTVNSMTTVEAESFGMPPEKRRNFFRLDGAKNNYAPIEEAEWFERVEVQLNNGGPGGVGDQVAAAWPWHPPKLWSSIPPNEVNRVMDIISEGPAPGVRFSPSKAGKNNARWVGTPVVETLGVNAQQAGAMIAAWLKSGLLTRETYHDAEQHKDRTGVFVDDSKRPT